MTVICYKDGVMAADSQATAGWEILSNSFKKIAKLNDGSIIGISGDMHFLQKIIDWFNSDKQDAKPECKSEESFSLLLVKKDGSLWVGYKSLDLMEIKPDRGNYHAIGCGSEYAIGAMMMGASAVKAVEIACAVSAGCGLPVYALELDNDNSTN